MPRHLVGPAALTLLLLALWPSVARADAALLVGFTTGARLDSAGDARFLIGGGPDLLFASGLTLSARGELTHVLDGGAVLLAGWSGPGLRSDEGPSLGLAAGPALGWAADGAWSVGGRGRLSLGLWYARAILELDVTLLAPGGREDDPLLLISLALRWVPWAPWRF